MGGKIGEMGEHPLVLSARGTHASYADQASLAWFEHAVAVAPRATVAPISSGGPGWGAVSSTSASVRPPRGAGGAGLRRALGQPRTLPPIESGPGGTVAPERIFEQRIRSIG